MAEAARAYMARRLSKVDAMSGHEWGNAYTRALLGVRLDLGQGNGWSMAKPFASPPPAEVGDRAPDGVVYDSNGRQMRLHDLFGRTFTALHFTDARRQPLVPQSTDPWLRHFVVSRWDAPRNSPIRDRALLDPGDHMLARYGCAPETLVLVRPDDHIAAIVPSIAGAAERAYRAATNFTPMEVAPK
jgi:3-(3-hydroxy-phenyl)propionate hydroxylase